jgi:DNA-binding IclR family transcriptional regulator
VTPLRASQVETLRFIGEGENGRTQTEVATRFTWGRAETWRALENLRARGGFLKRKGSRFYLTQLGKEALASSGKELGG